MKEAKTRAISVLVDALAQSDELNVYVGKATCELGGLSRAECAALLRLIDKQKPTDAGEAGVLAILKHIIKEA
jgi:hypothetical protein